MPNLDLHTKHRPKLWKEVVGQEDVVASMQDVLAKGTARAFLLTGPSGVGKTTIGRILAAKVGCTPANLMEVDAATHSGAEAMRSLTDSLQYAAMGDSPTKVLILDEAHALSKQAWQSVLKSLEEPPAHVYWVLCTTELAKVPDTVRTRCVCYALKPVRPKLILELLRKVAAAEKLGVNGEVLPLLADKAGGSPRRALTWLAQCTAATDRAAAARLIDTVASGTEAEGAVLELCRGIARGLDWPLVTQLLEPLRDQNAESVRQVVLDYFTKAALGAKEPKRAAAALTILDAFSRPFLNQGPTDLVVALGTLVFNAE